MAEAQETLKPEVRWAYILVDGSTWDEYKRSTIEGACRAKGTGVIVSDYEPESFTHFDVTFNDIYGIPVVVTCYGENGHGIETQITIERMCRDVDVYGNAVEPSIKTTANCENVELIKQCSPSSPSAGRPTSNSNPAGNSAESTNETVGDPVDLISGVLTEDVRDWVSSKDSRFQILRSYRSDLVSLYSYKFSRQSVHAGVWRAWFDEIIFANKGRPVPVPDPEPGTNKNWNIYHKWDGGSYLFHYGTGGAGDYPAVSAENPYTMTYGQGVYTLRDGKGHISLFRGDATNGYQLSERIFPDGYSVKFDRTDAEGMEGLVVAMSDSKGQRAEFVYSQVTTGSNVDSFLTRIEIDVDYDGSAFAPEYAVNYSYGDNPTVTRRRLLESVTFEDLASGQTAETARYIYDGEHFPPPLLSIYDGRLNDQGQPFPNSTFSYSQKGMGTASIVAGSSHYGGADGHTFSIFEPDPIDPDARIPSGIASATNSLGRVTNYGYTEVEGQLRLTNVDGVATPSCDPTSQEIDYTAPADQPEGFVYSRTHRNGSVTTYDRNSKGLVLSKTEGAGSTDARVTSYTWHADLRLPLTRTTDQMVETFVYNEGPNGEVSLVSYTQTDNLATSPSLGESRTWTYNYSTLSSGLIVLSSVDGPGLLSDGINDVTSYEYDANGNLTKVIAPNNLVTEYMALNKAGQPTLVREPDGIEWALGYDSRGRVISAVRNPGGTPEEAYAFAYDVVGQIVSYTDPSGGGASFTYDEARRLIKVVNPAGEVAQYEHDLMGNVTRTAYSDGVSAETFWENAAYDELGRLKETLGAAGQNWGFAHDEEDNLKKVTDPFLNEASYGFDGLNRLSSVTDRDGGITTQEHDTADQLTKFTDPRNIDTIFAYNGFGEVVSETSADRGTISYTYDKRGLVTTMTDGRGIVSNYTYDHAGRVTARTFPTDPSQDQFFTYDLADNTNLGVSKIGLIEDEAGSIARRYGQGGYLTRDFRRIDGQSYDIRYTYDDMGRLSKMLTPGQLLVRYSYDADGRIASVTAQRRVRDEVSNAFPPSFTVVSDAQYLPLGPLASWRYGDGASHIRRYDNSYRLRRLRDVQSGTVLRDETYVWSIRDNLIRENDLLSSTQTELFQYDAREHLSRASGGYGQIDFDYDSVGNRISRVLTDGPVSVTDSYSYPSDSNRLQSIVTSAGASRSLTHDLAGNVIQDDRFGTVYGYDYNAAGRMARFTLNGALQAEYKYNALGQQVVQHNAVIGQIIHVVHDLDGNRIAEYDVDPGTGTASLLREYLWANGEPVAVVDGATDAVYFIRTDHIGRPLFATDVTGAKVWEASYLPFGGVRVSSGDAIALRFPGQWFQSESGLHQNWMRDYDPTTGRYIQADPLGLVDGASVYGYALQNPGRYTDQRGEACRVIGHDKYGTPRLECDDRPYCPSGDCAYRYPRDNNREFQQCMAECETSIRKAGKFIACTAAGATVGAVTGTSVAGSFVVSTGCKIIVSEMMCGQACGGNSCEAPME